MSKRRPTPPDAYTVLLIGGGGREHALAWKLRESPKVRAIYATHHQNAGVASLAEPIDHAFSMRELYRLDMFCEKRGVNLVVVGPEAPLAEGVADALAKPGRVVFGPGKQAAQLEADKAWSKQIMPPPSPPPRGRFPPPRGGQLPPRDPRGAAGHQGHRARRRKGSTSREPRRGEPPSTIMVQRRFGDAGAQVLIEERLTGPRPRSCAGRRPLHPPARPGPGPQRIGEGDTGPNTGGMGAYCPRPSSPTTR